MPQESVLRVGIDSRDMVSGAKRGETALSRLSKTAHVTEGRLSGLESRTNALSRVLGAVSTIAVVSGFARLSDAAANIRSKISLLTESVREQTDIYQKLLSVSNETRSSFENNAGALTRFVFSLQSMGFSMREGNVMALDLIETLNKMAAVGGASTAEAASATLQLSQALASGVLAGDEFKAIAENMPLLMKAIVDALNDVAGSAKYTRGDLKELASDSRLTSDIVIGAIQRIAPEIDSQFAKIKPTVSSSLTVIRNQVVDYFDGINRGLGAGRLFSQLLLTISDNFDIAAGAATGLATVIGIHLVRAMSVAAAAAVRSMAVAWAATGPVGKAVQAVVLALSLAASAVVSFGNKTVEVGGASYRVFDLAREAIRRVAVSFHELFVSVQTVASNIWSAFKSSLNNIIGAVYATVNSIVVIFGRLPEIFSEIGIRSVNALISSFESGLQSLAQATHAFLGMVGLGGAFSPENLFDLSSWKTEAPKAISEISSIINDEFKSSIGQDFLGEAASASLGFIRDKAMMVAESLAETIDPVVGLTDKVSESTDAVKFSLDGLDTALKTKVKTIKTFGDRVNDIAKRMREGFANAVGDAIVRGESFRQTLVSIAKEGLSTLISATVELGMKWLANQALAQTLGAAAVAATSASASAAAAVWAAPAALASLATLGTNATAATTGIMTTIGMTKGLAMSGLGGFAYGADYVSGPGTSRSDSLLARLSSGEGIVTARANRDNPGMVSAMNNGERIGRDVVLNITVEQHGAVDVDVDRVTPTDVRIIAREVATEVVEQRSEGVFSRQIAQPNSRMSKAFASNFKVNRQR